MDSLRRPSRAVEIEALYHRALSSAARLLVMMGPQATALTVRIKEEAKKLEDAFDRSFFRSGFYLDRIPAVPGGGRTANALIPVLCGFRAHEKEVLDAIESGDFTAPAGVRCHALGEGFSNGYHTGMVWSLTTAWASAAEFAAGRPEKGWEYLKTLISSMEGDALGAVGECWDSLTSERRGCGLQLWGSASIPMLVDRFMLGIRPDAARRCVFVNPALPREIGRLERELSVGGVVTRLDFRKGKGGVSVSSSNNKIRVINSAEQIIM
jgi:glycogen debranching enzyme